MYLVLSSHLPTAMEFQYRDGETPNPTPPANATGQGNGLSETDLAFEAGLRRGIEVGIRQGVELAFHAQNRRGNEFSPDFPSSTYSLLPTPPLEPGNIKETERMLDRCGLSSSNRTSKASTGFLPALEIPIASDTIATEKISKAVEEECGEIGATATGKATVLRCKACGVVCNSKLTLATHVAGKKHKKMVEWAGRR